MRVAAAGRLRGRAEFAARAGGRRGGPLAGGCRLLGGRLLHGPGTGFGCWGGASRQNGNRDHGGMGLNEGLQLHATMKGGAFLEETEPSA